MKDFVMIQSKDYLDVGTNQRIYVFSDVTEYEEQIQVMMNNNVHLSELQNMIESWGGKLEIYLLNELIKNYKKN